ncbi:hypothetical protein AB6A40_001507 [Gnathostoma spinigerum]|uniref:Sushi domain-containing protein n=1 Tax=Gnathostoma spinigerum TaxID=75299 RepID=A0ABD6E4A8_9BILA
MINGQVKYNGKIIVEGTTAIVSCEAGYKTRSIASGIARCQRSGKWTVELRCEPVDECPSMTVPGGHVRYEFDGKPAQTIKEGTIAVLTCSSGFAVGAIPQSVCYGSSWHPENIGPCNI